MARIIVDYFLPTELDRRPKIFGMTASPINTKGDVQKAIDALETFLQSKIVTTPDMTLLAHAPRARNEEWEYERLHMPFETDLHQNISQLGYIEELGDYFEFAKEATSQLGPWLSDQIWRYILGSEHEITKTVQHFEQSKTYKELGSSVLKEQAIRRIQDAGKVVKQHTFLPPTASPKDLSSKTLLLFHHLSSTYLEDPDTRCIVFVDRRITAQLLCSCFRQLNVRNLRPGILLGVNKIGPVVDQLESSSKKQETMMEHFKAGLINCVFATNVAEEG
jgi:endoribonuclease Dicer